MIDDGDLSTREEISESDGIRPEIVLVSEDLATRGIRAQFVVAKGNGDPCMAGKIQDYIEEF